MAVRGVRTEANEKLIEFVCQDVMYLTNNQEILILGDFNGHISELEGYTDVNGNLLMQLAERLLDIAFLDHRCDGQFRWCDRAMCNIYR